MPRRTRPTNLTQALFAENPEIHAEAQESVVGKYATGVEEGGGVKPQPGFYEGAVAPNLR